MRALTLKSLGHVEENGRFWLCDSYANSRSDYKVIENYVIGYTFVGDGRLSPVRVAPIYRAAIWQRIGKLTSIKTSYEVGDYFNPHLSDPNDFYGEDRIANTMASTALQAISAVEARADERKEKRAPKLNKRKRR